MSADTHGVPTPVRRRPRDRKEQIVAVAADRFYRLGYHNVGTEEVASTVGITAGALYRHFRNKQELLATAIIAGLDRAAAAVEQSADDLHNVLTGLAGCAVERRDLGVLWTRESRHLNDEQRARMRQRFFVVPDRLNAVLRAARPELSTADADFLAWVLLAVLTSPSYHGTEMPPDQLADLLHRMSTTACGITTPDGRRDTAPAQAPASGLLPSSRREALLAAATRLFNQRGYHAVSMDDIGAAVGITSASVYNHFTVKSDLLVAMLARAAGSLQLDMSHALASASTAREALDGALDSYIRLALSHSDLIATLVSEVMNLPDQQRHDIRQLQHDYVAEWVHLLRTNRPDLDEPAARFVVHATLTVINDVARTRRLRDRVDVAQDLHDVATALLHATPTS